MPNKQLLQSAIAVIAAVPGVEMSQRHLAEDVLLLFCAFPQEDEYMAAVLNTCKALAQLAEGRVTPGSLKCQFVDWQAYHYQHKVAQGARADMRIVFQTTEVDIRVRAFGYRNLLYDFYQRLASL